jgi:hypothetical protein
MKATKALKRLAKIEASISDVVERYVTLAPAVRKALHDAMAAVVVAKEAVSLEVSSGAASNPPLQHPPLKKEEAAAPVKRSSKKATAKKAVKTSTAKAAKKVAPVKRAEVKKAVKKSATKKTVPIAVQAVTETPV